MKFATSSDLKYRLFSVAFVKQVESSEESVYRTSLQSQAPTPPSHTHFKRFLNSSHKKKKEIKKQNKKNTFVIFKILIRRGGGGVYCVIH